MEIRLTIEEIDYAGLAEAVMPIAKAKLKDSGSPIPTLLSGIASLPAGMIKAVVNGLPQDSKDQMAVFLINSYKEKLISAAEHFGEENGVVLKIADVQAEQ